MRGIQEQQGGNMKLVKIVIVSAILLFVAAPSVFADDFGWMRDFDIQAHADPSGLQARLATRFNIGDLQVKAVLSNFENPSDAYIALRLGEMCGKPVDYVIDTYKSNKGGGWGRIAKSLGIKPGSEAFHALKQGHDLHQDNERVADYSSDDYGKNGKKKSKGTGKGKKRKR